MEGLSQNELIGVVTLIRDKKEYQQTIFDCGLLNELHQIVHHEQSSKNKYHGIWSEELKNKIIHQIIYRIVPKEERESFTNDHPLLLKINELKEDCERSSKISTSFICNMQGFYKEIDQLKKHIELIETTEIHDFIEKIKNLEYTIRHYEECFIKPLLKLEWIHEHEIVPPALNKNLNFNKDKCDYYRENITITLGLEYDIPHKRGFQEMYDNYQKEFNMNEKYKQKISKLIKEIEGLKKENDNLRKDNLVKLKELF